LPASGGWLILSTRTADFGIKVVRALVFDASLKFSAEYPDTPARARECLVQVLRAGICGTDLELMRGYMDFRGIAGHEFVGRVLSGDPRLLSKRVVGEINVGCGSCDLCKADLERHCPNRTVLGILDRAGAFADYLSLPARNLLEVPDSISDEAAVFCEPIAAAYEILEQVQLSGREKIAVIGDGRLGAIVALVLKAEGACPMVGGHHLEKLQKLAKLGLDAELAEKLKPGFDVIVDCSGATEGLSLALKFVRPRGTIILKSTAKGSGGLNLASAVVDEISIIGSRCGRFAPALAALAEGKIDPRPLVSATLPLSDGVHAFSLAAQPLTFKVLLSTGNSVLPA
jgi:threonine dehydrogenase-like Zn-dependent dehydrogenase